jgi:transitional endoplasmic reticulum ATPase
VLVSADTEINVKHSPAETDTLSIPRSVTAEDLGGLDETLATLRRAVVLPLDRPDVFEQFGREPPAVLVHGPPGSGKTSAGVALGTEADARFLPVVPGGEYHDPGTSVDVAAIRETATRAPTLVFFDDLDVLAPAQQGGETDASAVALSRLVDDLRDADGVTMLATAAAPEGVAAPLRRGDRFGREVAIKTPDRDARREILDVHFAGVPLSGVALDWIADRTPGFVAADIAQLVSESILQAIERLAGDSPRSLPPDSVVRQPDVEAALAAVSPSGLRDHTVEQPDVTYDDIGGLADVKRDLVRTVEWPLIYPDLFDRVQSDPPTGILLYGPPGTGKTMLARAVATSSGANFLAVSGPELFDRYVGESERAVRDVFDRARQNAPAVVFFDEIDALATRRDAAEENDVSDRVVSQLLTELDGIEPRTGVTVVGATNRPDLIDRALLRPGRFEKVLEVPLPDREARSEIFSTHLEDVPAVAAGIDVEPLAGATEGYSGSDIAAVVREAGLLAMEESLRATSFDGDTAARSVEVTQAHLRRAVETVDRSVTETMREEYESRADDLRT